MLKRCAPGRHRFTVLWCAALLALAQLAYPTQASADELSERLRPLSTWDELCAEVDCSAFPKGYSTWSIGGEVYYFPLYQALKVVPEVLSSATFNPEFGRFKELDEEGRVVRTFGYTAGSKTIHYCCNWLLNQAGISDQYPRFQDSSDSSPMRPAKLSIDAVDPKEPRYRWMTGNFPGEREDGLFRSYNAIDKTQMTSLSEDFWQVSLALKDDGRGIDYVVMLSKRPLLNGYYVLGSCLTNRSCQFQTIDFVNERGVRSHIDIRIFLLFEFVSRPCDEPASLAACSEGFEAFEKIGPALSVLDTMLERLTVRPDDVEIQ